MTEAESPSDRKRRLARERQRRKRERGEGIGVVRVPTHLATLGSLLREATYLEPDADDSPATLARGLAKMLDDWAASVTRDADGITSGDGVLTYREGKWILDLGD